MDIRLTMIIILFEDHRKLQAYNFKSYERFKGFLDQNITEVKRLYCPTSMVLFFKEHFPNKIEKFVFFAGLETGNIYSYTSDVQIFYRFPPNHIMDELNDKMFLSNLGWPSFSDDIIKFENAILFTKFDLGNRYRIFEEAQIYDYSKFLDLKKLYFYGAIYPDRQKIINRIEKLGYEVVIDQIDLKEDSISERMIKNECFAALSLDGLEVLCYRDNELALSKVPVFRFCHNNKMDYSYAGGFYVCQDEESFLLNCHEYEREATDERQLRVAQSYHWALCLEFLRQAYNGQYYALILEYECGFKYLQDSLLEIIPISREKILFEREELLDLENKLLAMILAKVI